MGVKFANNAYGTLNASIASGDTSLTLSSGQGARFPSLGAGDYFYATLIDTSNNLEIVKCTARTSDVLTITRGQEGTTARAYTVGDRVELRVTAAGLEDATDIDTILPSQTGNSGKFLTTNGSASSWGTVPAAYGLQSMQVFTASGTWTKPSGVTKVRVIVTGGGGGGGQGNATDGASGTGGAGGGGGATAIKIIDVSSVSSVSVTVGAAGSGATSNVTGGSGGTSSFGSYCSATGGSGGESSETAGYNSTASGGQRGTATGGDINLEGTKGAEGMGSGTTSVAIGIGGEGGASYWGANVAEYRGDTVVSGQGQPARQYGVGGSGGGETNNNGTSNGGNGGSGVVVVEEYA